MSKKIFWIILYLFFSINFLLLIIYNIDYVLEKKITIFSFDKISNNWCQKTINEKYWLQDQEKVIKKILNQVNFLNQQNLAKTPSTNLRVLNTYLFSNYIVIDLSADFSFIKEKEIELYYIGSYLYFLKENFSHLLEVKFIMNGYPLPHLAGLYYYDNFLSLKNLEEIIFPNC